MGVRFTGVGVPAGARIVAAWVQFTVDERSTTAAALQIRAVAEGNPAAFAGRYGVTLRPLTQAAVAWSPPAWDSVGAAGAGQRTPDLAGVLQELVDRADWTAGNSVALVLSGSGKRVAEAYEGSRSAAPLLHIDYQAGSGPTNQPPQVTAAAVPAVTTAPGSITLDGTISDDGLPNPPAAVTVSLGPNPGPRHRHHQQPHQPRHHRLPPPTRHLHLPTHRHRRPSHHPNHHHRHRQPARPCGLHSGGAGGGGG